MKKLLFFVTLISTLALGGVYRNLQFVFATVGIQQGTTVLMPTRGVYSIPTVKGTITVTCGWDQGLTVPQVPAAGSVQMELLIDGFPTHSYFWGPPCAQAIDTAKLTDGTHSLAWQVLDSTGVTYPADQLRAYSVTFVVMNKGPISGVQQVATTGDFRHGAVVLDGTDFVTYPGSPIHSTVVPYPYKFIPPNSAQPRNTNNWFVANINETRNMTYAGDPQFYQTKTGGVVMRYFAPSFGLSSSQAWKLGFRFHQNFDGGRGDNRVSPYSSIVELPDGSGWAGVELNGRMWMVGHDGSVDTCAGPQPRRDVLQYDYRDTSITAAQLAAKTNMIGTGDTRMADVTDLAFDPRNYFIVYEADSLDNRILKIDLSVNPPVFTNYAGTYGQAGNVDGASQSAKFNRPFSLVMGQDGTLYISDFGNGAIRMVSPDGSTVSTLVGGSQPSMAYVAANRNLYAPAGTVSFAQADITYPQGLRMDSKGNLIVIEGATEAVKLINRTAQTVRTIAVASGTNSTESWTWLDVDTKGTIGPKDDILVVIPVGGFKPVGGGPGSSDLWTAWKIAEDGSYIGALHWNGVQNGGYAPLVNQAINHYPWAIAISKFEGKFITAGYSNEGLSEFHILQASDPTGPVNTSMFTHGAQMWRQGSVTGFPWNSRPAFAILGGWSGAGHSGLNVDGLNAQFPAPIPCTSLSQESRLESYIQNGFNGDIARPEFTGNDLRDLIYFLRRSSMQYGETGNYQPCPTQTGPSPVISSVQAMRTGPTTATVTWITSTPTLGFVAYGSTVNYSGGSDLEGNYSTQHSIQLHDLPTKQPLHFAVVSKDDVGNQVNSVDGTF